MFPQALLDVGQKDQPFLLLSEDDGDILELFIHESFEFEFSFHCVGWGYGCFRSHGDQMERSSILIGVSCLKRGPFIGGGSAEGGGAYLG